MASLYKKKFLQVLTSLCEEEDLPWNPIYLQHLPKKYVKHGDLLMLPASTLHFWKDLDQTKLMKCIAEVFKVKRIAVEDKILNDDNRTPSVKLVYGDNGFVTHIDNRIRYSFDVTKCMFSSGNITEKIRMSQLNCENEVVVDMFAGIGYFTLPLLVHARAKLLYACEWNPNAIEALEYNLIDNKVADRCVVLKGDNREITLKGVANRVVLGLIPSAEASYEAACKVLNPSSVGTLHIHGNVTSERNTETKNLEKLTEISCNRKLKPEWLIWATQTSQKITDLLNYGTQSCVWTATIDHIERVKSYAPKIDHLVLDLKCLSSVTF